MIIETLADAACGVAERNGDSDQYYYENERFHFSIYEGSHSGFLAEQCKALHRRLQPYRRLQLRVRNSSGDTVPLGSFTTVRDISGPYRVPRYNIYPAAELDGNAAPGYSQGQAIDIMQKLAAEVLPPGFSYEWTTLAFQQIRAGDTAMFAFVLGVVFVFLVLAAQYESLTLPLAVILIVPMCLVAAILGVIIRGMDNNILTQVGFIATGIGAHGLYPSRDGKRLYVANRGSHKIHGARKGNGGVVVIDFASEKIVARWGVPGGGSPDMGNVSVDGRYLWLAARYDDVIYRFDTTSGAVAQVKVGAEPHGLTVWPQPGRYSLGHTGNLR